MRRRPLHQAGPYPCPLTHPPSQVEVFYARAGNWLPCRAECQRILSNAELDRESRFRFQQDRDRFLIRSAVRRILLAHHTGCRPIEVEIQALSAGKPELSWPGCQPQIHFNASHSAGLILLAVTQGVEVGIDVEATRPLPELDGIVERHFCSSELHALASLTGPARLEFFYQLWTAKEAVLKATGDGIGEFLGDVEVSVVEDGSYRLLRVPHGRPGASDWSLIPLRPADGYIGALAVPMKPVEITTRWLNPDDLPF